MAEKEGCGCAMKGAFLIGRHRRLIRFRDPSHAAFFDESKAKAPAKAPRKGASRGRSK